MALRSKDVETAKGLHLFICSLPLGANLLLCSPELLFRGLCTAESTCQGIRGAAKLYVRSTTCHVRGYRDCSLCTCVLNDKRLSCMVLCIQDLVWDSHALEKSGNKLRLLYGHRANEDRLTCFMYTLYLVADCLVLELLVQIYKVVLVNALHWNVGWYYDYIQIVDGCKLRGLCVSSTGHS